MRAARTNQTAPVWCAVWPSPTTASVSRIPGACASPGRLLLAASASQTSGGSSYLRIGIEVGTQQGLGFELSFRITDQDPAHRHARQACGVPHGRSRSDLDHALFAPVPLSDLGWLPNGGRVLGYLRKVVQPLALYARPSYLMRAS